MLRWIRSASVAAVALGIMTTVSPSQGAHHLWRLAQVFSNASGSAQFVQLNCPAAGENNIGPFGITSNGHSFSFATNLASGTSTANSWVLVATSNFGSLPGAIPPDYVLPVSSFFSTGGDTLTYAGGVDTWTFGTVPTDGVHSLMRDGTTPQNSLINFAGTTGSVNLAAPTPALPSTAIAVLVGAILVAGSGLLRKRNAAAGASARAA
jgi:hypothetical protein